MSLNQFSWKIGSGSGSGGSGGGNATLIQGVTVSTASPSNGQVLGFTGGQWLPVAVAGTGTVTSIGMSFLSSAIFLVGPTSPITDSGVFSVTLLNQAPNTFLSAPSGATGTPAFRGITLADLTVISHGITSPSSVFAFNPATIGPSGVISMTLLNEAPNTIFASPNGATGTPTFRALVAGDLPAGTGTVTSVGASFLANAIFFVSPGTITTSGVFSVTLLNQAPGTFFSVDGATATPSFRTIALTDLGVISHGITTASPVFAFNPATIGASGIIGMTLLNEAPNTFFSAPSGATGTPTFRALVSADLPSNQKIASFGVLIGDGTNALSTGPQNGVVEVPFAHTITAIRVFSSGISIISGSAVIDVWRDSYANFPPTSADSIFASSHIILSSTNKYEDTTLTGVTATGAAGAIYRYNLDSVSTFSGLAISFTVNKT